MRNPPRGCSGKDNTEFGKSSFDKKTSTVEHDLEASIQAIQDWMALVYSPAMLRFSAFIIEFGVLSSFVKDSAQ